MDTYNNIIELAKTIRYQNLFLASKEVSGIRLFKNTFNFSKIQEIFLSYLYTFNTLHQDIMSYNVSEHVLDNEIYWDSYLLFKRKNKGNKKEDTMTDTTHDLRLVAGRTIKFKKKEGK
jgi:hypothetical protein